MFSEELSKILKELNSYKRSREELLFHYVEEKLSKSLEVYSKDLDSSKRYLQSRKVLNVARKINNE